MTGLKHAAARAAAFAGIVLAAAACAPTSSDTTEMKTDSAPSAQTEVAATQPGTVVDGAVASADHTTLVSAVQAAGLVETLSGAGPFTVFAPTNAAFAKLPAGTVDTLLQPANRATLAGILTYHVVAGRLTAADLAAQAAANGGSATLTTVQGATLTVTPSANGVTVTDARGGSANVTAADVAQSNGVIHVVDTVLMPPA